MSNSPIPNDIVEIYDRIPGGNAGGNVRLQLSPSPAPSNPLPFAEPPLPNLNPKSLNLPLAPATPPAINTPEYVAQPLALPRVDVPAGSVGPLQIGTSPVNEQGWIDPETFSPPSGQTESAPEGSTDTLDLGDPGSSPSGGEIANNRDFIDILDNILERILEEERTPIDNMEAGISYRVFWNAINWFGQDLAVSFGGGSLFFNTRGNFQIIQKDGYGYPGGKGIFVNYLHNGNIIEERVVIGVTGGLYEINYYVSAADAIIPGTFQILRIERADNGQPVQGSERVTTTPQPDLIRSTEQKLPTIVVDVQDVIDTIMDRIPNSPNSKPVLDTLKALSPEDLTDIVRGDGLDELIELIDEIVRGNDSAEETRDRLEQELERINERLETIRDSQELTEAAEATRNDLERISEQQSAQRELIRQAAREAQNPANQPTPTPSLTDTLLPILGATAVATGVGTGLGSSPGNTNTPASVPANTPRPNPVPTDQTRINERVDRRTNPNPTPNPSRRPSCQNTDDPVLNCLSNIEAELNNQKNSGNQLSDFLRERLDTLLGALNALLQGIDLTMLNTINSKLGAQLPGGLSGFLVDKFTKLWRSRVVDRALNLMATAAAIHNAVMLSRDIGPTLVATLANSLSIIGIKDADDQAYSISQAIGNSIENLIKGLVGTENYTQLSETWAKANRIYQAGINIYQSVTDSMWGIKEGLELSAEYMGKIGNALKSGAVVIENAYDWMSESFNFGTSKNRTIQRVIDGLDTAQNVASDLETITGEFRNVTENINFINQEVNTIKTEINTEKNQKTATENQSKADSSSPAIPNESMQRN
jgi:hypothetical protein